MHATTAKESPLTLNTLAPLVPKAVLPTFGFVVVDVSALIDVPLTPTAELSLVLIATTEAEVEFA